jgi:hypothetical protein
MRSPILLKIRYGTGRAAELVQDRGKAKAYYKKLLVVASKADTDRPRLEHARRYLDSGNGNY